MLLSPARSRYHWLRACVKTATRTYTNRHTHPDKSKRTQISRDAVLQITSGRDQQSGHIGGFPPGLILLFHFLQEANFSQKLQKCKFVAINVYLACIQGMITDDDPNAKKTVLLTKPQHMEKAMNLFGDTGVAVTCD